MKVWPERWQICFGWLPSREECENLETWLDEHIPGWQPRELHTAIDAYAEAAREDGQCRTRAPTGPHLKTLILRSRHEARQAASNAGEQTVKCRVPSGHTRYIALSVLRAMIEKEPDPKERWEIVGYPFDLHFKEELKKYAHTLPGGVERFDWKTAPRFCARKGSS